MTNLHVLGYRQAVGCLLDADTIVGLRTETGKLYQVVVTFHRPFVGNGNGIDGRCILKIHLIVVDGEIGRIFSTLKLALLDFTNNATRAVCHLSFKRNQLVVLAA